MSRYSVDLRAALVTGRIVGFARRLQLAGLAIALALVINSPSPAQVATDAILQLDMLDTPTDDLIRLSTAYADALRDLKSARLSIDTVRGLLRSASVTNLELQIANINLEAAERKVQILRMIAEKQLEAAENKLEIVKYIETLGNPMVRKGANGEDRNFIRANDEATVRILKTILAMK